MTRSLAALVLALSAFMPVASRADDAITVAGLLDEGYAVVSAFMTQIGPGIFLQKEASLYLCFVTETSDNPVIATNYCKQVR